MTAVTTKEKVFSARMRIAQHYVETIVQLGSVYNQGFENNEYAIAAFDAEQEQVESWFDWLMKQAEEDEKAAVLVNRFLSKGAPILNTRLSATNLSDWYERGLGVAQRLGDLRSEAQFLDIAGNCIRDMGQKERTEAMMKQSCELARQVGDPQQLAYSLLGLAYCYQESGRYQEFRPLADEALALFRDMHDTKGMVQSLRVWSWVAVSTGDLDLAEQCNQEAYELAMKLGHYRDISFVLSMIGSVDFYRQRLPEAMEHFKQSLDFGQRGGDYLPVATALTSLGSVAAVMEDFPTAEMYMLKTMEFSKRMGLLTYVSLTLCNLGALKFDLNDYDGSTHYLEQAITQQRELKMGFQTCETLIALVTNYLLIDRYDDARHALRESLEMAQQLAVEKLKRMAVTAAAHLWLEPALKDGDLERTALALQWYSLGNEDTLQIPARRIFEPHMPDIERILGKTRTEELINQGKELNPDEVIDYILSAIS